MITNRPRETRITIRFPAEVAQALKELAQRDDRSINSEVVHAAREFIARKLKREQEEAR